MRFHVVLDNFSLGVPVSACIALREGDGRVEEAGYDGLETGVGGHTEFGDEAAAEVGVALIGGLEAAPNCHVLGVVWVSGLGFCKRKGMSGKRELL